VRVGMEATGHARWFERLMAELGFELWIGDPAEIATRRVRKQKTDRHHAQLLLKLLLEDRVPRVWVRASSSLAASPGTRRPHIRFLFIGSRVCSHASFRLRLTATPLRFAITSPSSGCEEDFHLQAIDPAGRTNKSGTLSRAAFDPESR